MNQSTNESLWELDEAHAEFQTVCRRFVDDHVRPHVETSEQTGTFPPELWQRMGQAGLLGLRSPERFGGSEADSLAVAILAEELGRASGGLAITPLVSSYMAGSHIVAYGSDAQHEQYVPRLVAGEIVAAIAVTEPMAGSDVAAIRTTAETTSNGYVLRGTKMFITNAGLADVIIVAAKTDPSAGHRGITTFVVDRGHAGMSVSPPLTKMGWRSSDTREVVFDDCVVAPAQVLGQPGRGFYQIMSAFQLERVVLAAMGVGLAAEAASLARQYARDRMVFGAPLGDKQTIRHMLAEMDTQVHVARLITHQAAARIDSGHPEVESTVAMAKLVAARIANDVADDAVQIFGGSGYMDEMPVARHYRDARILRIGGGTDEIQLDILAKRAAAS
jgi:acyl-CoA dehydrogenase/citronellyl-CoA dehydrogenase